MCLPAMKEEISCSGEDDHLSQVSTASKLGRKGDPRMHKAVAARLANPKLSLTEALRIGGFEYAVDDDSTTVDAENITLSQRKNQLSRRVRLVRQQQEIAKLQQNPKAMQSNNTPESSPTEYELKLQRLMEQNLKHHLNIRSQCKVAGNETVVDTQNTQSSDVSTLFAEPPGTSNSANMGGKIPSSVTLKAAPSNVLPHGASSVAPSNFGPLDPTKMSSLQNQTESYMDIISQVEYALNPTTTAVPPSTSQNEIQGKKSSSHPSTFFHQESIPMQNQTNFDCSPNPVVLQSLVRAASDMGLTLDQLAIALNNNSHDRQAIIAESQKGMVKGRQELALALYRNESKALYKRSMLLAGYDKSTVEREEKSEEFVQFAILAWQQEGQELQKLLQERSRHQGGEHSATCGTISNTADTRNQGNGTQLSNNAWNTEIQNVPIVLPYQSMTQRNGNDVMAAFPQSLDHAVNDDLSRKRSYTDVNEKQTLPPVSSESSELSDMFNFAGEQGQQFQQNVLIPQYPSNGPGIDFLSNDRLVASTQEFQQSHALALDQSSAWGTDVFTNQPSNTDSSHAGASADGMNNYYK